MTVTFRYVWLNGSESGMEWLAPDDVSDDAIQAEFEVWLKLIGAPLKEDGGGSWWVDSADESEQE